MLTLRLITAADAADVADIYRPIVASTTISFETEAPGAADIERRIEDTLPTFPWLVCEDRGRIVGYAYASRHRPRAAYRWSVDTSVYVRPDFHRQGVGRGLYASLFRILEAQGFVSAYAGIALPNPGSVGLHEAMGFQPIGIYRNAGFKLGAWHDVGWWQLAIQAPVAEPRSPLTLREVQTDPAWPSLVTTGLPHIREKSRPASGNGAR